MLTVIFVAAHWNAPMRRETERTQQSGVRGIVGRFECCDRLDPAVSVVRSLSASRTDLGCRNV